MSQTQQCVCLRVCVCTWKGNGKVVATTKSEKGIPSHEREVLPSIAKKKV